MKPYQITFGDDYSLGIRIPEYFVDQSYRNDAGPLFAYVNSFRLLKICILPEAPEEREIEGGLRYTLMEMKTAPDDDDQEFVDVIFETESSEVSKQLVYDESRLKKNHSIAGGGLYLFIAGSVKLITYPVCALFAGQRKFHYKFA